jgi:ubiquinone/menaquinone biosynthesis C-methylase UbiE
VIISNQQVALSRNMISTLADDERAASYDKIAAGYDLLVGNPLYNRIIWGCSVAEYNGAAGRFLAKLPNEPIIDFGCGSCIFTAKAYQGHESRLTLFDRSLGMLERAAKRLPQGQFVQGDALAAPFADNSFAGAMGWGTSHVFGTKAPYLSELHRIVRGGGSVVLSSLCLSNRYLGNRMMSLLEKQGEAIPETADQISDAFGQYFEIAEKRQVGSMLFLTGVKQAK